mgnify:CR=1 FL=1
MLEHIQYKLRDFALKYGAGLIYTSNLPSTNIVKLAEYLSYILLNKENNNLNVQLDDHLFIPAGYDKHEILQERFKDSLEYMFQRD